MNSNERTVSLENALDHTSAALATGRLQPGNGRVSLVIDAANPAAFRVTGTATPDGLAQFFESALSAHVDGDGADVTEPRIDVEHSFERSDTGTAHVIIEISRLGADGGPGTPVAIYLKDITPGRTLQREMERLSALPEANPNIVMIIGCPDRIEYVNATGRQWLVDHHCDDTDSLRALLPAELGTVVCASCGREERSSWSITHAERTYDVRRTPLSDHERCMVTISDVTQLVALTRQHEIFFRAFQSAHNAIMVTGSDGRIQYVNQHFEQLYGYTSEQILGNTPNLLNPGRDAYRELGYSDEDYHALFRSMWQAIQDPQVGYWEHEIPNRSADGRLVWVRLLIHAVRDETGALSSYIGFPIDITDSRERELKLRLEAYEAISDLAELRDNETGNHIKRVGRYAMELARSLGHSKNFQEELLNFAPLHDIGKVGIPDDILLAPRKLSDEEFGTMQRHTLLGYELFRSRPSLETAASIARSHHERWDGAGYPDGLADVEIPLCARIVSVCDVYDALLGCEECIWDIRAALPDENAARS